MQQHLGALDFFQSGAKAGYQGVRQVTDETYRVGEQNTPAAGQLKRPELGVERGEHARGGQNAGTGEPVKECALAGIRVANQRHGWDGNRLAALPLLAADAADGIELAAQVDEAALN